MKIPDDMYEHVFALVTGMTDAAGAEDVQAYWQLYEKLEAYCAAQSERDHPFLWETLADFTMDDQAALALYLKALSKAQLLGNAHYEASSLLSLAERHKDMGNMDLAYRYALEASAKAKFLDNAALRRNIGEFLASGFRKTRK